MDNNIMAHVKDSQTWLRLFFMLMFAVIYSVAEIVLTAVVIFQFLVRLFTGKSNERVLRLGGQISTFIYQILNYLTFNSEERPYPFADWPAAPVGEKTAEVQVSGAGGNEESAEASQSPAGDEDKAKDSDKGESGGQKES